MIQEEILERLERIKRDKKRGEYFKPKEYTEFAPKTLGIKQKDQSLAYERLDEVDRRGRLATQTTEVIEAGRRDRQEMIRRRRELARAKKMLNQAKSAQPKFSPNVQGGHIHGGSSGGRPANFPVGVGQNLRTINWRGHSLTLNEYAIPRFTGFLNALYQTGYRPVTIGSYSNRNIAGSGQKSLHAYGLAIDIDPSKNPVQYGSNNHALPPRIGALAAKYGLSWGGSWNSYKDPMHFSVPYGGRE